ncbi:MAG: orotidine-5'-phosphate decarboxylase [Naasia sp.]
MTAGTRDFGSRLRSVLAEAGPLCVGIDPHPHLLDAWGLEDSAAGAREFGLRCIDAAAGTAGIVKPQVAFFERFGSAGFAALEDVLAAARMAGLLVIADAKRGDVGSTMDAYAAAWLTSGAPLEADALTVAPYLGSGSLAGAAAQALDAGKGLFVLAATSNPEAAELQTAVVARGGEAGATVAGSLAAQIAQIDRATTPGALASIGLVLGATVDLADLGVDLDAVAAAGTPVLAPGFGFQGASPADVRGIFGPAAHSVIISASRSILAVGPEKVADAIRQHAQQIREALS